MEVARRNKDCDSDTKSETVAPGKRRSVRKRKNLSPEEILEIVHKVVVQQQMQKDVAKEHRLKPILVC